MDRDRLAHMEDVTRRYGKYRPCGAGLGVLWGGLLLGVLGVLLLQWTRHEYAASAVPSQTLWRFLRDTPLTPPGWLQIAATVSPFIGWLGLLAIAAWAVVWGRRSRDQLLVMFAVSVPSLYLMLATDPNANLAAGDLIIFGTYFFLMMWLLLQGVMRFSRFLKVRADLAAIQPVDE